MLKTDPKRNGKTQYRCGTAVFIQGTGTVDAGYLDAESFLRWLRLRGGYNPWAENLVMRLLGYRDSPDTEVPEGHERAVAGLAIAVEGLYDFTVDVSVHGVGRSQHQAELLLLGFGRSDNSFTLRLT